MESMNLPEERRTHIIEMLNEKGKVTPPDLSRRLGVSIDTIRRDLIHLENAGQLTKVHGGALPPSPATAPYPIRRSQKSTEKIQIAKTTAKLIQPGQIVFMDSGTTVEETARQLPVDLKATIVTASLPVATALAEHKNINVIMPGGTLDPESMTLSGSTALDGLRCIRADVCILGICSIDPDAGLTCTGFEEVAIKQTFINNAKQIIIPVTKDKLGTAAPFGIAGADSVTLLVTEKSVSDEQLKPYQTLGIQIEKV